VTMESRTVLAGTVTAPASGSTTLLDIAGPKSISSIRMHVPGVDTTTIQVTDDGRAFGSGGYSQFVVATNPANTGVRVCCTSR